MKTPIFRGVDSGLIEKAYEKNRPAIQQLCETVAELISELSAHFVDGCDADTEFVATALRRIGGGMEPNDAFGWVRRGEAFRPKEDNSLRNYNIKKSVQDKLCEQLEQSSAPKKGRGRKPSPLRTAVRAVIADGWRSTYIPMNGEIKDSVNKYDISERQMMNICKGLTKDAELPFPENLFPIRPFQRQLKKRTGKG